MAEGGAPPAEQLASSAAPPAATAPTTTTATAENEPPKISKAAAAKAAKKAAAKLAKEKSKAEKAANPALTAKPAAVAVAAAPVDPNANFKQGWLKGVYQEKPVAEVQTRFPPEPNGYLHIGHAKAITVNFGFARAYGGKCNLRFDDTNPAKEEERYFTSIKDMVSWLGFSPSRITHSSDFFDELYDMAEELIRRGKGYVCHCSAEAVNKGRGGAEHGPRSVCAHWSRSVDENMAEFRAMRDGKYKAGEAFLRMKQFLSMKPEEYEVKDDDDAEAKEAKRKLKSLAENPAMWDVTAYRVKDQNYHHRTGDKWRIYPSYEFAHCICDSLEGVTHSLCTVEFETLRPAYNWLLEVLDLKVPASEEKGPMQREYGRLNVEGTILSKRRIQMLVQGTTIGGSSKPSAGAAPEEEDQEQQLADLKIDDEEDASAAATSKPVNTTSAITLPPVVRGWDDPRLFTLVAIRRRGVPPGALKKFVLDLGVTKANADTKMHMLDSSIRTYLERTVPRLMLVLDPIKVVIDNLAADYVEERDVPFDPKDKAKGTHTVPFTNVIYIDRDDFRDVDDPDFFRLSPGQSVGLLHAEHPLRLKSVTKRLDDGRVAEIVADYGAHVPAGKARIHWVGEKGHFKAEARCFNPLFKTPRPNELDWKTGGYYHDMNPDSEIIYPNAMIESGFEEVKRRAPWPEEEGEKEASGPESIRFQAVRTAYFCVDRDSTDDKIVLNRIVGLKEDTGKRV